MDPISHLPSYPDLVPPWPGKQRQVAELCALQGRLSESSLDLTGVLNEKIWKNARKLILMMGGGLKRSS